ncbi:MAG: NAD(P)/FAD-dependent oxidoreductase [Hyphomicrobiaceae bacterium]
MTQTRRTTQPPVADVAIIGAGVMGLSVASAAVRAGLAAVLVEPIGLGAEASGTPLAALMPHLPGVAPPTPEQRFQLDALAGLHGHVSRLQDETGLDVGYARCGRVIPIHTEGFRRRADQAAEGAARHWAAMRTWGIEPRPTLSVVAPDACSAVPDWLRLGASLEAVVVETLSARIDGRAYLEALARAFERRGGRILTATAHIWRADRHVLEDPEGTPIVAAGALVLAAGAQSYTFAARHGWPLEGRAVKGQALAVSVLRPDRKTRRGRLIRPLIFDRGLYVVERTDGSLAIGSTTETTFKNAAPDVAATDALLARARGLCVPLAEAPAEALVINRWAGLRPRARRGGPQIGLVDQTARVYAATGGYKISFGIAHAAADAIVEQIVTGEPSPGLPSEFAPLPRGSRR